MFQRLKDYFKKLKEERDYRKFCRTTSDYIIQTNDRHKNHVAVTGIMPHLEGITNGFINSMESVYFAFMRVYGRDLTNMRIRGYRIELTPDYKVIFHIFTYRPGLIIGKGGKDIDKLNKELQYSFGVPVTIELHEEKISIAASYLRH